MKSVLFVSFLFSPYLRYCIGEARMTKKRRGQADPLALSVAELARATSVVRHQSRDHYVHALSQWETAFHCNVVSHWLGAYTEWNIVHRRYYVHGSCLLWLGTDWFADWSLWNLADVVASRYQSDAIVLTPNPTASLFDEILRWTHYGWMWSQLPQM